MGNGDRTTEESRRRQSDERDRQAARQTETGPGSGYREPPISDRRTEKTIEPTPYKDIDIPQQRVEVVGATTGADKYITKVKGRDNLPVQKVLTRTEIETLGGKIPERARYESLIHQEVMRGTSYEKAVEKVIGTAEAKKRGMTQKELTDLIREKDFEKTLEKFCDKYGLSLTSAAQLIIDYHDNPDAPKFRQLNRWERRDIEQFSGAVGYIESTTWNIAWKKLLKANKKNPQILKTVYINGKQIQVLNLAEATKSGIKASTLNIIGKSIGPQWGKSYPLIIKSNSSAPWKLYPSGFKGITQNDLNEIRAQEKGREQLDSLLKEKGVPQKYNAVTLIEAGIDDKKALNELGYDVSDEDIKNIKEFNKYITAADTPQELKEAYRKGGYSEYEKAFNEYKIRADKAMAKFYRDNVVQSGKSLSREVFYSLDSKYQRIALTQGFDAMESAMRQDDLKQVIALKQLESAQNKDGSYDVDKLASYARTNKGYQDTIKAAGFEEPESLIAEIEKHNKSPLARDEFTRRYFEDRGWSINVTATKADLFKVIAKERGKGLTAEQKETARVFDQQVKEAHQAYRKEYGVVTEAMSAVGTDISETIFTPARALRPDVELKEISGLEWGMGVAQVAILSLPFVGAAVGKLGSMAIMAGAGGVFTYGTVKNWDDMTTTERRIAVAFDILIIAGAAGAGIRALKGANLTRGKAGAVVKNNLKGVKPKVKAEVEATIKDINQAIEAKDSIALKQAGEILRQKAKQIPKEKGGKVLESKGKFISDKAGEIVKIAEKRLSIKQASDLTNRLKNNMDFIESPAQKVIARYRDIEMQMARARKEIRSNESLIRKAEAEKPSKTEKIDLTKGDIEAKKVELNQQISKDNADLFELRNKGGEPRDIQMLTERIRDARAQIARFEKQTSIVDRGKLKEAARDEISRLNSRLDTLSRERTRLLNSDEATRLWGAKVAGKPPGEPIERGKLPETGKGGRVATIEKSVRVKPKTEVKEKVKKVDPDIDKLRKAKEKYKTETKTRVKPSTRTKTGARTERQVRASPFVTTVRIAPGVLISYPSVIGKRAFEKLIEQTKVTTTAPGVSTRAEAETAAGVKIIKPVTKGKAATKKGIEEKPGARTLTVIKPVIQPKAGTKAAVSQPQPQPKPQPQPLPQPRQGLLPRPTPKPLPQPLPKPEPLKVIVKTTTKKKQKPILPPSGGSKDKDWTPEEVKSAIAWKDGFNVIAIKAPFRRGIDEKSFNINKVPPGLVVMKNYKGSGSQERSARIRGNVFPGKLTVDVGNQDVLITRSKGKLRLRHVRDTRGTRSQTTIKKGRNISVKKGRIFRTRAAGGTILSRKPMKGY